MSSTSKQISPAAVQILAATIVLAIAVYVGIGIMWIVVVNQPPILDANTASLMGIAFVPLGIILAALSFITKSVINNQPAANTLQGKMRTTIVALSVAEAPAVLGVVHVLLSNMLIYAVFLWAISLIVAIMHFPRRDWLES